MGNKGVERLGVEAVILKHSEFLRGLKSMEDAYDRATRHMDEGAKGAGTAMSFLGGVAGGAALLGVTALLGGVVNLVRSGFNTAIEAAGNFVSSLAEIGLRGLQTAGRFEEMEIAAFATGRAVGLSREEIQGAIDTIHDLNIRYDVAASTVAQFARNNIDLASATDLVRIAQGAAILAGVDSSEMMERLTWAVTTHNTTSLVRMGIIVDLTAAEERFAAGLDKTREQLTEAERTQADVNAVIERGANLTEIYAAVMEGSWTKALRSLADRVLPELNAAMMQGFLPAAATVVNAVLKLGDAFRRAMEEGGALYPVIVRIGAYASILADAFASGVEEIVNAVTGMRGDVTDSLVEFVDEAAQWGVEIAAALAEGIVKGASWALSAAMDFVGWLLASFLAPGSPPKVAPGLTDWGAAAMTEYLRGFTEADFSILEKLQGPLKSVLGGSEFARVSEDIARALTSGAGADFYNRLAQSAGAFGNEIAELARREFAYAEALDAVNRANQQYEDSQQKIVSLTTEYNRMLREGASREKLQAKLAEINAAEKEKQAAATERQNAATDLDDLKEQALLQEKLVSQLVELARAQQQAAAAGAAAAAGGGGLAVPGAEAMAGVWDLGTRLSAAIEEAKAALADRIPGLLAPLRDAWSEIQATLFGREEGWVFDAETMRPMFIEGQEGLLQRWDKFWNEDLPGAMEDFSTFADAFIDDPFGTLGQKIGDAFKESWETTGKAEVTGTLENILGVLVPGPVQLARFIRDAAVFAQDVIIGLVDGFRRAWPLVSELLFGNVNAAGKVSGITASSGLVGGLISSFTDRVDSFIEAGRKLVEGVISGIRQKIADAISTARGVADTILGIIRDALGEHSQSKEGFDIGANLGQSIIAGYSKAMGKGLPGMAEPFGGLSPSSSMAGASVSTVHHVVTISPQANFGPISMNTPMDQATFNAMAKTWFAGLGA